MVKSALELDIFPSGEDPRDLSEKNNAPIPPMYRKVKIGELPVDPYDPSTEAAIELAWKINKAIDDDPVNPIIDGKPFGEYMATVGSKGISGEYVTFLMEASPSVIPRRRNVPELTASDERRQETRMDNAGFTAGETTGRTPLRSAQKRAAFYAIEGPLPKKPKKKSIYIPDKPLFGFEAWPEESLQKLRELRALFPARKTALERQLEAREDIRISKIVGKNSPESAARRLMGVEVGQEEEIIVEPWTEADKKDLQWIHAREGFYPNDKKELKLELSLIGKHNFEQIPVWQRLDSLNEMVLDPSKEAKRQAILRGVRDFLSLFDDAVLGVRYADDLIARMKDLKKTGLESGVKLEGLFPIDELKKDMLLRDQLAHVASFHEASMIVAGTPVTGATVKETQSEYALRVLGDKSPQKFNAILVEYSTSVMNKLQYAQLRLEEARIHAYVRDEVLGKLESVRNELF